MLQISEICNADLKKYLLTHTYLTVFLMKSITLRVNNNSQSVSLGAGNHFKIAWWFWGHPYPLCDIIANIYNNQQITEQSWMLMFSRGKNMTRWTWSTFSVKESYDFPTIYIYLVLYMHYFYFHIILGEVKLLSTFPFQIWITCEIALICSRG